MTNAELFKQTFNGLMATELWAMSEKDFLEWLNKEEPNDRQVEQKKNKG